MVSDTPHYENEVPFEIPEGWCWCRLDDLAFYKKGPFGSSLTKSMFVPDSSDAYKVYEQKNAINKDATLGHYYIDKSKFEELKGFAVQPEDIIVSCAGTIGETYVLPHDIRDGIINQALMTIRLFDKSISDFYLLYFDFILKSEAAKESKGTAIKNIPPFDILKNFIIPLPPQTEQKRIIEKVSYWLSLVDAIDGEGSEMSNLISKAKSKILDLAIHGKLVPQDPNDEPAIELLKRINPKFTPCDNAHYQFEHPQNWSLCSVGDIASIIGGVSYKKDDIQASGIRILRGGNIQDGTIITASDDVFISELYYNDENEVKDGDIVVVASTGSSVLIGKTGYAKNIPAHTQIGAFLRIVRPHHLLSSKYMNYHFLSNDYKTYIRNIAKGSNINNIKNNYLSEYVIALPPYKEQLRIVSKIEELFSVLDEIKESLEA